MPRRHATPADAVPYPLDGLVPGRWVRLAARAEASAAEVLPASVSVAAGEVALISRTRPDGTVDIFARLEQEVA